MQEFLKFPLIEAYNIKVVDLLAALFILAAIRGIWYLLDKMLLRHFRRIDIDEGAQWATRQILKYVLYTFAILSALQTLGFHLTALWASAAALLVGFGLGMQQTFNDFTSGLILLFERSVKVGDRVQFGDQIGRVSKINARTSEIVTDDNQTLLVPNSKLVTDTVHSWNRHDDKAVFTISMRLNYGADEKHAAELLTRVALAHVDVLKTPAPEIRIKEFAETDMELEMRFWTKNYHHVEKIKSDLRFSSLEKLREAGIVYEPVV